MGSLTFGSTLCCSPIAGILVDKIGIRLTAFLGASIACVALLISSFVSHYVSLCLNLQPRIYCTLQYTFAIDWCFIPHLWLFAGFWPKFGLFSITDHCRALF